MTTNPDGLLDALLLSTEAMRQEMATALRFALGMLPTKDVVPHLLVRCRDGDHPEEPGSLIVYALAVNSNEYEEKYPLLEYLGEQTYLTSKLPVFICLLSEAWQSAQKPGQPHVEPRHDPQRQEVVVLQGMGPTSDSKRQFMQVVPVARDSRGRMVAGTPEELHTDGVECRLLHAFWRGFFRRFLGAVKP